MHSKYHFPSKKAAPTDKTAKIMYSPGMNQQRNNSKNRNQRRNNNSNRKRTRPSSEQGQRNAKSGGGNRNRRNHYNRRRGPKNRGLGSEGIQAKYDNLLEKHLMARKKYFELYYRVDNKYKKRLENNFAQTIEHLRKFESSLAPWQQEQLKKKVDQYPLDTTYSLNRDLEIEVLPTFAPKEKPAESDETFEDPHILTTQEERESYSEDIEESSGTMEDFEKYKAGLL